METHIMSAMDRVETNFRLTLITQREQGLLLQQVARTMTIIGNNVAEIATQMALLSTQVSAVATTVNEVATKLDEVARKGEETASRMEETIVAMRSFAEGQVDIRKTLADCVRRLDALEGKKAS